LQLTVARDASLRRGIRVYAPRGALDTLSTRVPAVLINTILSTKPAIFLIQLHSEPDRSSADKKRLPARFTEVTCVQTRAVLIIAPLAQVPGGVGQNDDP